MSNLIRKFSILFVTLFLPVLALAVDTCDTHQSCPVAATCTCMVPAEAYYDRHYYFDVPEINQGIYACQFSGGPSSLQVDLGSSHIPAGGTVDCSGDHCPFFPVTLNLDLSHMDAKSDSVSFRYFVPASDIPDTVTFSCTLKTGAQFKSQQ